jgi:hypothetical protein
MLGQSLECNEDFSSCIIHSVSLNLLFDESYLMNHIFNIIFQDINATIFDLLHVKSVGLGLNLFKTEIGSYQL